MPLVRNISDFHVILSEGFYGVCIDFPCHSERSIEDAESKNPFSQLGIRAGMARGKFVQGAVRVVTSLTRSVRYFLKRKNPYKRRGEIWWGMYRTFLSF